MPDANGDEMLIGCVDNAPVAPDDGVEEDSCWDGFMSEENVEEGEELMDCAYVCVWAWI
jgi:hypothetical protein